MKGLIGTLICIGMLGLGTKALAARPLVYVIPIRKAIEPALLYVIRRGVAEAESKQADAVIFTMDTPGGTVDAAREIVYTIQRIQVPTYTFVEKDAFSAGAVIALSTKHIYMAPGSVIGDALPIMVSPIGGVQETSDSVEEKSVSAVAALIRSAAEQGGHDKDLAEAMVRREIEYSVGERIISPEGQLLTLTNEEAAETGPDGRPLLSAGTVASVDELLKRIGMHGAEIIELQVTGAEKIARFIAALGPLLMMLGMLGLYIEFRTPGFGLPGILGLFALAIFFWGHHVAGLAGSEDLMLVVLGMILLLVELTVLPDFGFVGILGIFLMLGGLLMAMVYRFPGGSLLPEMSDLGPPFIKLATALAGTVVGAALLGRWLPRSRTFSRLSLNATTDRASGYRASDDHKTLIGAGGSAVTALRPAGAATIGGRRLDVVTEGDFIEKGAPLHVVEVHGGRIIVESGSPDKDTNS